MSHIVYLTLYVSHCMSPIECLILYMLYCASTCFNINFAFLLIILELPLFKALLHIQIMQCLQGLIISFNCINAYNCVCIFHYAVRCTNFWSQLCKPLLVHVPRFVASVCQTTIYSTYLTSRHIPEKN